MIRFCESEGMEDREGKDLKRAQMLGGRVGQRPSHYTIEEANIEERKGNGHPRATC